MSHKKKKISDKVVFSSVNYTEMIPILIGAVKEQNEIIESLKSEVAAQKSEIENLKFLFAEIKSETKNGRLTITSSEETSNALLGQNIPNPFSNSTIIPFRIPKGCNSASISITEITGKVIRVIPVSCRETQLTLETGTLESAMYFYSLIVDGINVDTKQMSLLK
ncbi:MAG: hypothetical protein JJE25_10905 [Bacteroidia bacterium]|nr:hypothetical protein [Bacteroidia bacterium]